MLESIDKINKYGSIAMFLVWNTCMLTFPTVILSLGGSWLWYLFAIPFLMSEVPDKIIEVVEIEEDGGQ